MIHEDQDMMAAMNVTDVDLSEFGYSDNVSLQDPLAPIFRAKTYTGTDLNQVRNQLIPFFLNFNAYPNPVAVSAALSSFWATATPAPIVSPTTFDKVKRTAEATLV